MTDKTDGPWSTGWKYVRDLDEGGQGLTRVVENNSSGAAAVMKVLREPKDVQARQRMFQEVNNLKILANAKLNVPAVLDSNVERFDSSDELFFVMTLIEGRSLKSLIKEHGPLSLDAAIGLALAVGRTVQSAHALNVQHRDMKPENIIIRSVSPPDAVIVDFGLSFNSMAPKDITRVDETLDNDFLSLPERRVPGGNRRDPRSDLVGVCAVLYYCITGEPPVDLADGEGMPPHRRRGRSLKDRLAGDKRAWRLEALLDRGFAGSTESRFQNADELIGRLVELQDTSSNAVPKMRAADFARTSGASLLKEHRASQLAALARVSIPLFQELWQEAGKMGHAIAPYILAFEGRHQTQPPSGCEAVPIQEALAVSHCLSVGLPPTVSGARAEVSYFLGAVGNECIVYRRIDARGVSPVHPMIRKELEGWRAIYRYDGSVKPELSVVLEDLEDAFVVGMQFLHETALGKAAGGAVGKPS